MYKINHPTRLRPFNYGYINKHDWEYRNALRQCRRNKKQYGVAFDNSEAYQLANAICLFMLTHNYPISKPYLYFKAQGVYKEQLFVLHPQFPKDFGGDNWVDEYEKVDVVAKEVICNLPTTRVIVISGYDEEYLRKIAFKNKVNLSKTKILCKSNIAKLLDTLKN